MNYVSARLARVVCDEVAAGDPTRILAPISPSVEVPAARNVTSDEFVETYLEQVVGLMDYRAAVFSALYGNDL
jgi:methionine synthase I (cobalamin-dependent)